MKSIIISKQQILNTTFKWATDGTVNAISKIEGNFPLIVINISDLLRRTIVGNTDMINITIANAMSAGKYSYLTIDFNEVSTSVPRCYATTDNNFTNMIICTSNLNITFAVPFLKSSIKNLTDGDRIKAAINKINLGDCEIWH